MTSTASTASTTSFTFQYFSDIHLEFFNENNPKINRMFIDKLKKQVYRPKYLLLAGDIGKATRNSYREFLTNISFLYEKIFITTGNHEYYNMPFQTMIEADNDIYNHCCSVPRKNIIFMQNSTYDITDKLSIYGGTFWTDIPITKHGVISNSINDYSKIPNFTPLKSTQMHQRATSLLQSEISKGSCDKRWIVMSHHMPSLSLIDPKYRGDPRSNDINHAFASDIVVANDPKILAWVYGHTHSPCVDGKFFCNPIGYPGENNKWSLEKFITITV
jgi:hypothetical protein